MTAGITIIAVIAAMCGCLALLCLTAPEGWEDDDGWHAGREGE